MYVFSIVLIVSSSILYHVCTKSTPKNANPFVSLFVTYLISAIFCIIAFLFCKNDKNLFRSLKEINWTSIALGICLVGLEFGYIMAYRSGWDISLGSLVANIIIALILIPIGILFYKEGLNSEKIIGAILCIIGLIIINKK